MPRVVSGNKTIVRETIVKEVTQGFQQKEIEKLAEILAKSMAQEMLQELLTKLPQGMYAPGVAPSVKPGVALDESVADVTKESNFTKSAELGATSTSTEQAIGKSDKLKELLRKK